MKAVCSILAITLCSCSVPMPAAQVQALCDQVNKPLQTIRQTSNVQIESTQWNGSFQAVLVARSQPFGVRLQLFPSVGGKFLDVVTTDQTQRGLIPMMGTWHDSTTAKDNPLLGMFAASIGEAHSRLTPDRVLRAWTERNGTAWMQLEPRFGVQSCLLSLSTNGILRYHLQSQASWTMSVSNREISISAPDFHLTAVIEASETLRNLPANIFELTRPKQISQ